jgi:hypothetical protein
MIEQSEFEELLKGLSPEDIILAVSDYVYFGTAFIKEIDGVKRRIAPSDIERPKTFDEPAYRKKSWFDDDGQFGAGA